jgi:hypothetical protein
MTRPHAFSDLVLPELGPASGLALLGFRAFAFGKESCFCVQNGYRQALGADSEAALQAVGHFVRALSEEGRRRIMLSAPGCGRLTRDEVSVTCALSAAQAWDQGALDAHLSWLFARMVPPAVAEAAADVGDVFAAHALGFSAPEAARAVPQGLTPAFSLVRGGA